MAENFSFDFRRILSTSKKAGVTRHLNIRSKYYVTLYIPWQRATTSRNNPVTSDGATRTRDYLLGGMITESGQIFGFFDPSLFKIRTKMSLVLETSDPESGQGGQGPRQVSYAVIRTYEHSGGRSFRRIHQSAAILSISMFAHLPSGMILIRVPDGVKVTERSAEVSKKTIALFTELLREKAWVMRMVTVLTTIQRNSGGNVNVLDIEEDDGVDD
ncbi:hypothetical protein GGX14DRAFT_401412 [Mycena pura]|uniref:Uncharacterized protein n=1 Tax=Mycena pura TaxID=153505 RepID=A0AAD6V0W6_9AGAR|nr:hypothetical protein GGX14DRAFT_401412 [Mycena pura]